MILFFETEEDARACVEQYKEAILNDGDSIVAERISFSQPQSSMVIIDQHTGYVKGIVGGRGEKNCQSYP